MKEEAIIRLITDTLSPEEREKVLIWISESDENREEYYRLKNLWALTSQSNLVVDTGNQEVKIFQKNIRKHKTRVLKTRTFAFVKYAAIILIAFFAGKSIFQRDETAPERAELFNEISVPPGQMAQLTLSDGTTVFINSCSKLKYPAEFKPGERRVYLSGEAYFSVTKSHNPFMVESNNRVVKVLGTEFNVMCYPNDALFQTTLIKGKVALLDTSGNKLAMLKPGEQYSLDFEKDRQDIDRVNSTIYTSWKDGLYVFDHETLEELVKRMERVFAVKINIRNDQIRNYKFTGTIRRNVPFEQILKVIQISAPIKYELKESNGAIEEVNLF